MFVSTNWKAYTRNVSVDSSERRNECLEETEVRRLKFSLPQYIYIFCILMYYLLKMSEILK